MLLLNHKQSLTSDFALSVLFLPLAAATFFGRKTEPVATGMVRFNGSCASDSL